MMPDGSRVSTLRTDAETSRERATARVPCGTAESPPHSELQVDEKCVSCGHRGLNFHTMQARGRVAVAAPPDAPSSCAAPTKARQSSTTARLASTRGQCTREHRRGGGVHSVGMATLDETNHRA